MIKGLIRGLKSSFEMVDITQKEVTHRTAVAQGKVVFSSEGFLHLQQKGSNKGDVPRIAEFAGIMGAKATSSLLPLCHPVPINKVKVEISYDKPSLSMIVEATAISDAKTGVEMEALTAVSISCLTIYDMCKNFEKNLQITDIKLLSKEKSKIE